MQTLEAGYSLRQDFVYEWMLWLFQQITGPVGPSFLILKFALLTVTSAFFHLSAKHFWRIGLSSIGNIVIVADLSNKMEHP